MNLINLIESIDITAFLQLIRFRFLQVWGLLCRCHNDVTGLVFEHNLTDAETAKKSKVLSGSKNVNYC